MGDKLSEVAVKVIKRGAPKKLPNFDTVESDKPSNDKPNKIPRIGLVSIEEKIAEDNSLIKKNWLYPGGSEEFPHEASMQWVDSYYPHALPKPLLVDHAPRAWQIARCQRKAEVMKRLGFRYLYVTPNMTVEQARMQLGEL